MSAVLTPILWVVFAISGLVLAVVWALWREATRRTDTNLGRDDIEAIYTHRKEVDAR